MSSSGNVDYRNSHFEYPELTRITGRPTYETLNELRSQLKANAASVYSNLGGGQHGHLFLTISPAQFAMLSDVPFTRPVHPGPLIIPPGTTAAMTATITAQHSEQIRLFREVTGVDKALMQQLVQAIDTTYLAEFRNRVTRQMDGPLHTVLSRLFERYGDVSPDHIQQELVRLQNTTYDPATPIDVIYNSIEDFVDLSESAGVPYSLRQSVNLGYVLLNKTGYFRESILSWKRKNLAEQTWANFKTHFRQASDDLRSVTDRPIAHSEFNQANLIQDIVQNIRDVITPTTVEETHPSTLSDYFANAIQERNMNAQSIAALLDVTKKMQQVQLQQKSLIDDLTKQLDPDQHHHRRFGRKNLPPRQYCWTHGWCAHAGTECRHKIQGHKDNATVSNRLNGSTKNVPAEHL